MQKRKIPVIKNKKIRIIWAIICATVLVTFIVWVTIWIMGWYKLDIRLMKIGIWMSVISWILMWILHIIYFRTPKRLKEKLFGE